MIAIHKKDLIHRDIKPENIFIMPNQESDGNELIVKIGDLGLSKNLNLQ